jgi:thiol:disulfide interchange protein DsbC
VFLGLVQTASAEEKMLAESQFGKIGQMNVVLQDPALQIIGVVDKPDSYVVRLEAKSSMGVQRFTAILDKQSSELYIGSAYDKTGHMIDFPKDMNVVKEGVAFSYGTGKKEIYLVTDPECPYCSRFEQSAHGKLDDYTVHVIFYPLPFHKKAPAMVEWIMQGKSDAEKRAKLYGQSPLEAAITRQKAYENMTNVPPRHSYTKAIVGDVQPVAGSARIDPIPYGHPMSDKDYLTKVIREKNHMDGKGLDGNSYSAYDVLNPVAGKMEYPTSSRLMDTLIHNAKRKVDSRAMLKRNDEEIASMFNQGTPLDEALKIQQDRWSRIPAHGTQTGTALGLTAGAQ